MSCSIRKCTVHVCFFRVGSQLGLKAIKRIRDADLDSAASVAAGSTDDVVSKI